jgi:hypothetical protein
MRLAIFVPLVVLATFLLVLTGQYVWNTQLTAALPFVKPVTFSQFLLIFLLARAFGGR